MNLVWLCPAVGKPVGGVKVIYRQAALADALLRRAGQGQSVVMHPNTWRSKAPWFDGEVPVRRQWFGLQWVGKPTLTDVSRVFDPAVDTVIIPELWVRKYGVQLHRLGVRYAIYVQNGYFIHKGAREDLAQAYAQAHCILVVSEDAQRCVEMAFPQAHAPIHRMHCSIDAQRFFVDPSVDKENLITYMPRKLADHSSKVLFFLREHLPPHWRIEAIDRFGEAQVAKVLQRSRIFMSFSHFEGLGLPPLEAALCGNQVVGYTGQGGKEFWLPQAFIEIEMGDVLGYAEAVASLARQFDAGHAAPPESGLLHTLQTRYGVDQEHQDLQALIALLAAAPQSSSTRLAG